MDTRHAFQQTSKSTAVLKNLGQLNSFINFLRLSSLSGGKASCPLDPQTVQLSNTCCPKKDSLASFTLSVGNLDGTKRDSYLLTTSLGFIRSSCFDDDIIGKESLSSDSPKLLSVSGMCWRVLFWLRQSCVRLNKT